MTESDGSGQCLICNNPDPAHKSNGFPCCKGCSTMLDNYELRAEERGKSVVSEIIEEAGLKKILDGDAETMDMTVKILQASYGEGGLNLNGDIYIRESNTIWPFIWKAMGTEYSKETLELVGGMDNVKDYFRRCCMEWLPQSRSQNL